MNFQKELSAIKKAKKQMDHTIGVLMPDLPPDKRKEAKKLLSAARKGSGSIEGILKFVGNMSAADKADLEKRFKTAKDTKFSI